VVTDLLVCLDNPLLAMLQWDEVFSVVEVRSLIFTKTRPGGMRGGESASRAAFERGAGALHGEVVECACSSVKVVRRTWCSQMCPIQAAKQQHRDVLECSEEDGEVGTPPARTTSLSTVQNPGGVVH